MKSRVKKLERMNKTSKIKRIKKVRSTRRIDTSDDTVMDDVSNQGGIIGNIDADEDVVLEDAKDVAASAKDGQDVDIDENADIQGRTAESKAQIYKIDLEHANKVLSADEVHDEDVPAASIVVEGDVSAANDKVPTADKVAQALEITKMKSRVKKLERMNKTSKIKRIKKVRSTRRIDTSDDTVMDDVSKQGGIIGNIDADEDVVLEDAKDVAASAKDGQDVDIDENADIQGRTAESKAQIYKIDLEHANKVLSMQDEEESKPVELQEVVDVVTTTKIIIEVVTAASTIITVVDVPIPAATTVAALTLTAAPSRRTKGVVIRDPKESATPSTIIHSEAKSKDKGKGILVEEPKPLKKQAQIKQDEQYARELEAE
nr:hypothetical protein [Tanacetum cinerariifolium]